MKYFIETERLKLRKLTHDDFKELCKILQDISCRVAEKVGIIIEGSYTRHYNGKDMPHLIYSISKEQFLKYE